MVHRSQNSIPGLNCIQWLVKFWRDLHLRTTESWRNAAVIQSAQILRRNHVSWWSWRRWASRHPNPIFQTVHDVIHRVLSPTSRQRRNALTLFSGWRFKGSLLDTAAATTKASISPQLRTHRCINLYPVGRRPQTETTRPWQQLSKKKNLNKK